VALATLRRIDARLSSPAETARKGRRAADEAAPRVGRVRDPRSARRSSWSCPARATSTANASIARATSAPSSASWPALSA